MASAMVVASTCEAGECRVFGKAIADYETGPGSRASAESAGAAIRAARRFVECLVNVLPANGQA
jgi:hypothetical protein